MQLSIEVYLIVATCMAEKPYLLQELSLMATVQKIMGLVLRFSTGTESLLEIETACALTIRM